MDSLEGQLLAGKYRVERVLGQGGMGVVVAAMHQQLEQRVALKFLVPSALENEEAVGRFVREARSAVRLTSEHVARVIDVGTLENGSPFIVMEYLDGCDLADVVSTRGPLSVCDAVDYVLQASEALAEAHASGIIHRDLKPANLFLTQRRDGTSCVKVLDFGIAKLIGKTTDPGLTRPTGAMGTPFYMSPEQMRSAKNADVRSDIWSIGIILYELLTGKLAFSQETLPELCTAILNDPPPPLRDRRPDVPEPLVAVVMTCLEKDPANRYADVAELAHALCAFGTARAQASVERIARVLANADTSRERPSVTPNVASDEPTLVDLGAGTTERVSSDELPLSRPRYGTWLLAGLCAALALGAGWSFTRGSPEAERELPSAIDVRPESSIPTSSSASLLPAEPPATASFARALTPPPPRPTPRPPVRVVRRVPIAAAPSARSLGAIPGDYGDRK